MRRALVAVAVLLCFAGCMELEQEATQKQVGQTVRSDTAPWNNEPLAMGPKWKKGDKVSWEEQIKKRQLGQHEHQRIYQ